MVPSKDSPIPYSGSLRSYSESDIADQEAVRVRTSYDEKLSAPCSISFDIGPAYHPRFLHKKSWEIESPEESESGSTHEPCNISPIVSLVSPLTFPAASTSSTLSIQGSSQRDDELIKEIDEATQRKSELREQLEMERAKSSALKKERDEAVLCASELKMKFDMVEMEKNDVEQQLQKTRHQISSLEKRRNGIFWGEKLALVPAGRDEAVTRELDNLELQEPAEKKTDGAMELVTRIYEYKKERMQERNEARRIVLERLGETQQAGKERDEAQRLAAENLEQAKQAQKLKNEAEVRVGNLLWEKFLKEGTQKERDEARRQLKEAKRESDLLREEIEKMKGENRERGRYWTSFLGALFD